MPLHHTSAATFSFANSLNAADVGGDGFDDYSVIDERRGLLTIIVAVRGFANAPDGSGFETSSPINANTSCSPSISDLSGNVVEMAVTPARDHRLAQGPLRERGRRLIVIAVVADQSRGNSDVIETLRFVSTVAVTRYPAPASKYP